MSQTMDVMFTNTVHNSVKGIDPLTSEVKGQCCTLYNVQKWLKAISSLASVIYNNTLAIRCLP